MHRFGFALMIALGISGCSNAPPASPPVASEQVKCDRCGKLVPRGDARAEINLEGLDVYTCKSCAAKPKKSSGGRRRS
jgi:hypothetical protein